jgi:iron complex outermembrane receptor protein
MLSIRVSKPGRRLDGQLKLTVAATLWATSLLAHAQASPAVPASAPQAPSAPAAGKTNNATLPTVNVTATRRSEPLQKVPVAVSVVTKKQIELSGSNNIQSLETQVPELDFKPALSGKDTIITIRGIGTNSTSQGVEPAVSTVVDGVVYERPGQATFDLLDIDHVEVLRGPQGTLFGKNATAGVINIVTQDPSKTPTAFVDTQFYQGGEERVQAGVSGTIIPGLLSGSFTALYGHYDGNVKNVYNGDEINGYDHKGFRAKFVLTPNNDIKATFVADYMYSHDTFASGVISSANPLYAAALAPIVPDIQNREVNYRNGPAELDTNWGVSAQVDWKLGGGYTLTSISAYRQWLNTQYTDEAWVPIAYTSIPAVHDVGTLGFTQLSQELRITSPKGGFFDYVAGLYALHGQTDEAYTRDVGVCASSPLPPVAPGLVPCANVTPFQGNAQFDTMTNNTSAYGEGTFHLTPRLNAILGARVTRDEIAYDFDRVSTAPIAIPGVNPSFASSGSTSSTGLSGRTGLQFDLTSNTMVYATYAHGYKGPAIDTFFNMAQRDTLVLKPEESNSYEIGVKTQTPDHRWTANLALYDAHYENYQANFFDTVAGQVVTRLINAGSVSTRGVELDVSGRPLDRLTFTGGLALNDARVDHFQCPSGAVATCDVDGTRLPFAPTFRGNLSADYHYPLTMGTQLEVYSNYFWQSREQYSLPQSTTTSQGAYGILNASIGLNFDTGWRVALIGKNLLNKYYVNAMGDGTGYVAIAVPRDAERYFGVQLHKDFF